MPKKSMALTSPAVAGSMKLLIMICHCSANDSYQGTRLDSCDRATFKRNARSGGAGLRPRAAMMLCVPARAELSAAHAAHDSVWRETACISAPVSALSRYEESMARMCSHWACVEFIASPQQHALRAHIPARVASFLRLRRSQVLLHVVLCTVPISFLAPGGHASGATLPFRVRRQ